jgi:hypothetical protein
MTTDFELQGGNARIVAMTFESVQGEGPVAPRLVLRFECRPMVPYTRVELRQLKTDVRFENELLGTATLREVVENVLQYGTGVTLDAPITREALAYIDQKRRSRWVDLMLTFKGYLRATQQPQGPGGFTETKDWEEYPVHSGQNTVRVSGDEWIGGVVEPLGGPSHVLLDLPLPKPPDQERWRAALDHLRQADRYYHDGNDEAVLQRCYAAFESLEGAPKAIFESLAGLDPGKQTKVDRALQSFRDYLQSGRHVSTAGTKEGDFDVNRRDADFALSQTKLWLTYIARLLTNGG